jgi:TolB protein
MIRVVGFVVAAALATVASGCDDHAEETAGSTTSSASSPAPSGGPKPCPMLKSDGRPLRAAGSIAFAAERRSGSELMVADVRAQKVRRQTRQRTPHDGISGSRPGWSPDGTRIAYSGGKGGWDGDNAYDDIWVISKRGGKPTRLTDSYESDWAPVWSPDGRRIAFDRQDDGYNWIYVVNADGTGLRRLTPNFRWHPAWTPDGRISYVDGDGIWVMNADGTDKRLLARADIKLTDPSPVAWSPDGRHVAFATNTALWVMRANGTGRRKVFGIGKGTARSPRWSPDSRRIAWTQGDGDLEIYVVNHDGSDLRNVTNNERVADEDVAWSPNGKALAYLRTCLQGPYDDRRPALVAMNLDGSGARRISRLPLGRWPTSPAWSP